MKIDVVGQAGSPVQQALVTGLRRVDSFTVEQARDLASAKIDLSNGDVDVVVAVPASANPAGGADLEVLYSASNFNTNQFALTTIARIVDGMNLQMSGVATPPIRVTERAVQARTVHYYDFLLPGLVAMGVMNISIIGMAVAITRFREQRILKRILATPLRPVRFLAAQVAARLVLSLAQAALILAVGVFVFHGHVYGNVLWILLLAVAANLVFLNIGFAVAGRASNPDAAQGLGQAIALPMMFLSGVFFPTDTLPKVVQVVVRYLPLTPLIQALRAIANDGKSILDVGHQLALLGLWVVVSFLIASRTFRFSEA